MDCPAVRSVGALYLLLERFVVERDLIFHNAFLAVAVGPHTPIAAFMFKRHSSAIKRPLQIA
jgi:hypothetical protein